MNADMVAFYRKKLKQMGRWMAARYMRNRDIPFEQAYFVIFDRAPRLL